MQLGSSVLSWRKNAPPWVLENHLFWNQKVNSQGHEAQKITGVDRGARMSAVVFRSLYE